jgi:hypothetical protein
VCQVCPTHASNTLPILPVFPCIFGNGVFGSRVLGRKF